MPPRKNLYDPDVTEMERIAILERRSYVNEWRKNNPDKVKQYTLRAFYNRAMKRKEAEAQKPEE
jgi:hypothetical protein